MSDAPRAPAAVRRSAGQARRRVRALGRRATAGRRMLPSFLILGAQKAGTTSLLAYLDEHPHVDGPVTKEIHYFDLAAHRDVAWYRSHFPLRREGAITGESTPYYLLHPLVARRVRDALPDVRLIVVLRDPVERAISHHNHEVALGYESLGLQEALDREAERLAGEEERLRTGERARSYAHQHYGYVDRGRYAEQLERWLELFARDRLLVLLSEELFADPVAAVHETQDFLGLRRHDPTDLRARNARSYEPADDAIRAALAERFREPNARLATLLGRDLPWS
jgi:hypothetical protein